MPTHFAIRKSEHTEKRIEIDWENGTPKIINSLGAPLSQLTLRSARGDLFRGKNIGPGDKVALEPIPSTPAKTDIQAFGKILLESSSKEDQPYLTNNLIPPSVYWAVIDRGSPFLENPLAYRNTKDVFMSHIIGVLTEEQDGP